MLHKLLFAILIFSSSLSHAQVPNAGFENWETDGNGKSYPEGWHASFKDSITQTSDAYEGTSAARIKPFQGIETVPSFLESKFSLGMNPYIFWCYIKTYIPNEDTVSVQVDLYKADTLTARKKWDTTETISTYQRIDLGFDASETDSAFVSIQSGCCAETGGADPLTTLKVDKLGFGTGIIGIQDSKNPEAVDVFPNPASKAFRIKGLEPSDAYQYKLYNILGQLAKSGNFQSQKSRINLEGLSKGVYQLFLIEESNGTVKSTKVIKQ